MQLQIYQPKALQRIIGNYPETLLKTSFHEVHAKYRNTYHILWRVGFPAQFPDGKIFCERMKICGDSHLRRTSIPGDCVKELLFCAKIWSVILVVLSNNFTWVTLCLRFFHIFFLHNGPKYQGHLSWHAGWCQCNLFNITFSLYHSPDECNTWNLKFWNLCCICAYWVWGIAITQYFMVWTQSSDGSTMQYLSVLKTKIHLSSLQYVKYFKYEYFKYDMSYALFNQLSCNFEMKTLFR